MKKSNEELCRKLSDNEYSYLKYEEIALPYFQIVFECNLRAELMLEESIML